MSDLLLSEFEDRQDDIDHICSLLQTFQDVELKNPNGTPVFSSSEVDQMVGILKSTVLLMSYNQVESTLRGCLEFLYDHFDDVGIEYNSLSPAVQKTILKGLLKKFESGEDLHRAIGSEIDTKIMRASLQTKKIFNGNIDRLKVRDIADSYGVIIEAPEEARNGVDLVFLKDLRNDLAHGNKTFSQRVALETVVECIAKTNRTSHFLRATILAFEQYITDEVYSRTA